MLGSRPGSGVGVIVAGGPRYQPVVQWAWALTALAVASIVAAVVFVQLASAPNSSRVGHRAAERHPAALPGGLAAAASARIGASDHAFWVARTAGVLETHGGGIGTTFTNSGARLQTTGGVLALSLTTIGRGAHLDSLAPAAPRGVANEVLYRHGSVTEFYRNGPYGLEQGFTIARRPEGRGAPISLGIAISGTLRPIAAAGRIAFLTHAGATVLTYGQLSASDASGRRLSAGMGISNGAVQLHIDDSGARYPLYIDPYVQQGSKLTGTGASGGASLGVSTALSSDGNTALVGGASDESNAGAAWVFTRSGGVWTQQGGKLTGSGEVGAGGFGTSVALSADGNTALIGGVADNKAAGAAWVFTRSGGVWTQQGAKLVGSGGVGQSEFGYSVALSSDGNTALIGGQLDNFSEGAAWVFTRSGSVWTQQGGKLTGSGGIASSGFGYSVALSSNGNTALIGGSYDNSSLGAAWVFTRSGTVWTQQGGKLTGSGESGIGFFGDSVALSSDGNTGLIGAQNDGPNGAAYVFTRSGTKWAQQGAKLTGSGVIGVAFWGDSVSLAGDGNTALIGAPGDNSHAGAAWVFGRSGAVWTQQGAKLTGSGETGTGDLGYRVAMSSDATTALLGGPGDNGGAGAAWIFAHRFSQLWSDSTLTTPLRSVTSPPVDQPDALELVNNGAVTIANRAKTEGPVLCNEVEALSTVLLNNGEAETKLALPAGVAEGDSCTQDSPEGPHLVPTYFDTSAAGAVAATISLGGGGPFTATIHKLKLSQAKGAVFCTVSLENAKGELRNATEGLVEESPPNLNMSFESVPATATCGSEKVSELFSANFFLETASTTTDTAFFG